ncbi:helix-turn-helix transcriptional regulator [Pseudonocardia sp. TRM90224]|uniref:helix-turn-helix transcriptional regulator n=1 Tax=Pseudonocardia sp. TRM90224 TaxID=2812678 RepID=UPI001E5F7DE2|nr:LuxR C-terminal-related transcriptional regulator [Pseudonocardia sp. TRM90224]
MSTAAPEAGAAAALAPMVEVWFRMLEEHVPDADNRCTACTGVRNTPWPCALHAVAEQARQWHASRTIPMPRRSPEGQRDASPRRPRWLRGNRRLPRPLTPREQEFLQLAANGYGDTEIAARLDVPERTVGTSLRRIGHALGAPQRSDLIVLAIREGVII